MVLFFANVWWYETLGNSQQLHCQGTTTFDARTETQITTSPPMFYDRMLAAGVIHLSKYLLHFQRFQLQLLTSCNDHLLIQLQYFS